MRVYYLPNGKIIKTWSEKFLQPMPEESPDTAINVPYQVMEIDEGANRKLCWDLMQNEVNVPGGVKVPDRFKVVNNQLVDTAGKTVEVKPAVKTALETEVEQLRAELTTVKSEIEELKAKSLGMK